MKPAFKRSLLLFLFGDLLFSLIVLLTSIHWLQTKIMLLQKGIHSSGYHLLLVLWNLLKGFESVLPAFV
jgi:hypothetical protein